MEEKKEKIDRFFDLLYPDFNELTPEEMIATADDYDLIRDNIEEIEKYFENTLNIYKTKGKPVTGQELIKQAIHMLKIKQEHTQSIEENEEQNEKNVEVEIEQTKNEEQIKPIEEQIEEIEKRPEIDKNKLSLLKEYMQTKAQLQFYRARVRVATFQKASQEAVENSVNGLKKYINSTAERYSQNITNTYRGYKAIIGLEWEYQNELENVKETYMEERKEIEETIAELEKKEIELLAEKTELKCNEDLQNYKEEIGALAIAGDKEGLEEKIAEYNEKAKPINDREKEIDEEIENIRNEKQSCNEELEKFETSFIDCIEYLRDNNNEKIANSSKEFRMIVPTKNRSVISRAIGWISNKINGTSRFMNGIIKPLQAKVTNFKENTIPEIKSKLTNETTEFLKKVEEKTQISEKANNAKESTIETVKSVKETLVDKPKKSFYSFLTSVQKFKEGIIEKTVNTISKDKEEIKNKKKQLENKKQKDVQVSEEDIERA